MQLHYFQALVPTAIYLVTYACVAGMHLQRFQTHSAPHLVQQRDDITLEVLPPIVVVVFAVVALVHPAVGTALVKNMSRSHAALSKVVEHARSVSHGRPRRHNTQHGMRHCKNDMQYSFERAGDAGDAYLGRSAAARRSLGSL